jgi:hypothetical protein
VAAPARWTDDRLDDRFFGLDTRVTMLAALPIEVTRLTEQLKAVNRELTHENGAVPTLARKLDELIENPRDRRERVRAFIHATVGGFVGVAGGALVIAAFHIHTG